MGIFLGIAIGFVKEYPKVNKREENEKMNKAKSILVRNISDFLPWQFKKK